MFGAVQQRHALPEWAQRRNLQQRPQANKNILPANEENDGLAYDSKGHVYVDDAVTDAATAVGPFDAAAAKRMGVCHFPTNARDPWQVRTGLVPGVTLVALHLGCAHTYTWDCSETLHSFICQHLGSWAWPWSC